MMVKENVLDKNTTLALEKSNQLSFKQRLSKVNKRIMRHWQLYVILLIPVVLVAIFSYGPMYGLQIAFKDYIPTYGISGSKWVGFKHFINFINSHQ